MSGETDVKNFSQRRSGHECARTLGGGRPLKVASVMFLLQKCAGKVCQKNTFTKRLAVF